MNATLLRSFTDNATEPVGGLGAARRGQVDMDTLGAPTVDCPHCGKPVAHPGYSGGQAAMAECPRCDALFHPKSRTRR
jgi:uncharacterized paraquat-inducible protein A